MDDVTGLYVATNVFARDALIELILRYLTRGSKADRCHGMLAVALRERIKQIGADERSYLAAPAGLRLVVGHSHG